MPPSLALLLWFILLVGLLRFDAAKDRGPAAALWVPVIWMFILGSGRPSQWLGGQVGIAAQAVEEGNPLDSAISSGLILLAIRNFFVAVFQLGQFLREESCLIAFLFLLC